MLRKSIFSLIFLALLLAPALAMAAGPTDFTPLVRCGGHNPDGSDQPACTPCSLFETVDRVINLITFGITGPIAVFMIILSGGMFLLGAGNPAMLGRAKAMLTNTLLGVAIILLAFIAVTFIIKTIAEDSQSSNWYEFTCPAYLSSLKDPKNLALSLTVTPIIYTPVALPSSLQAIPIGDIPGARIDLCPTTQTQGPCGKCPQYQAFIKKHAVGAATPALIEAVMYHESNCQVSVDHFDKNTGGYSYGLMQMYPAVANAFRSGCLTQLPDGKVDGTAINAGWLKDERHAGESICIAAKYLNSLVLQCGTDPRDIVAGYNAGPKYCGVSRDCPDIMSCSGKPMRAWECPWDNKDHTLVNDGLDVTKKYGAYIAACVK